MKYPEKCPPICDAAYFDRFDIAEAYWLFLTHWHDGRGVGRFSYGRLSHLLTWFGPSPMLRDYDHLTDNGRLIYDQLEAQMLDRAGA